MISAMPDERERVWLAIALFCLVGALATIIPDFIQPILFAVAGIVAAIGALRGSTSVRGAALTVLIVMTVGVAVPIILLTLLGNHVVEMPPAIDQIAETWAFGAPQLIVPSNLYLLLPNPYRVGTAACGIIWVLVAIATGALGARLRLRSFSLFLLSLGMVAATTFGLAVLSIAIGGDLGMEGP